MNDFHKIGSFIKLKMMEQNKSIQSLAEESGYSTKDIGKILDGRLFLSPKQIEEIAGILDLDINEMINCIDVDSIEYVGEFTKEENKDMLLDYIDRYVDLKEAT
ncbi:XRE family transcriptional regulator [Firmicutes bacterium AM55-24TS]|nr:XRE family transcriptional regulator [Firmicutes bacterium AM55-24TS]